MPSESVTGTEYISLLDALSRCDVMVTQRKKSEFKARDLVQDLVCLLKGPWNLFESWSLGLSLQQVL